LKIDFTPEDQSKLKLFANKGEAAVFWICICGLVILVFFTVFRYYSLSKLRNAYGGIEITPKQTLVRIDNLEKQGDLIKMQYDSLSMNLDDQKTMIDSMKNDVDNLKIKFGVISQQARPPVRSQPDSKKEEISNNKKNEVPKMKTIRIKTVANKRK